MTEKAFLKTDVNMGQYIPYEKLESVNGRVILKDYHGEFVKHENEIITNEHEAVKRIRRSLARQTTEMEEVDKRLQMGRKQRKREVNGIILTI